jgi:hypothetical protein
MRYLTWGLVTVLFVGSAGWTPDAIAGKGAPPPPPVASEPSPRFWHAFTGNGGASGDSSRLYVFGGQGGGTGSPVLLGDFWYYRTDTAQWTPAPTGRTKPGLRDGVGLSCGDGQCLLANGRRMGMLKETWVYTESTASWSQLNCTRYLCPPARGFPAAAYDPLRGQHVLFGGEPAEWSAAYLDDTYTFDGGRWTARSVSNRPPGRATAAAAFVGGPVNKVVMFGGADYAYHDAPSPHYSWEARCDLWAWDGAKWLSVVMKNQGPCLAFPAMAWDPVGARLIVASGATVVDGWEVPNRDVWYFKFDSAASGSWTRDAGSAFYSCASNASPGALMAYAVPGGKKVFFGGWKNTAGGVEAYANTTVCD